MYVLLLEISVVIIPYVLKRCKSENNGNNNLLTVQTRGAAALYFSQRNAGCMAEDLVQMCEKSTCGLSEETQPYKKFNNSLDEYAEIQMTDRHTGKT